MPPIKQALEAAKRARRLLMDQFNARYGDATSSSIPQRKMLKQIEQTDEKIKLLEGQLAELPPGEWGNTQGAETIQDIMDRYRSQHGYDYDPKNLTADPPRQMDMFEEAERLRRQQQNQMNKTYGTPWD